MAVDVFKRESIGGDEYYTLRQHVEDIADQLFIQPNTLIWCPFDTDDSMFPIVLRERGYKVVNTSSDFFTTDMPDGCGAIISNPPFSIKKEILNRIMELNVPFALLLPFLWMNDGVPFDYGSQIILWRKRVFFNTPEGVKNKPRATCFALSNGLFRYDYKLYHDR